MEPIALMLFSFFPEFVRFLMIPFGVETTGPSSTTGNKPAISATTSSENLKFN